MQKEAIDIMSEERQERQINIRELVFAVAQNWRKIFIFTILAMVVTLFLNIPSAISYLGKLGVVLIAKVLIKQLIFIGIATFVGCIIVYFFVYITSDKIKSVIDYSLNCDIKLLGVSTKENHRHKNMIDNLFKKCRGIGIYYSEQDEYIQRIINVIKAELSVRNKESKVEIALVSVCEKEIISKFMNLLNKKMQDDGIIFREAANILTSAESVETVTCVDYVIMVESEDKTTYSKLNSSIKLIASWEKDIIGMILVNVDAL